MPLHVAFGIGGTPDSPENTYLIPFDKIRYFDFIEQRLLDEYKWPKDLLDLKNYITKGFR